MNIFTTSFSPPSELTTPDFCLFPTNDKFYQSDYIAVMNNRELLRIWSESSWPEDEFTPQQNRADLGLHIEDNKNHTAYGYMIYSLDKKTCYGSLYVNPLAPIPDNYHVSEKELIILNTHEARLDYWVRQEDSMLEKNITKALKQWFQSTWKITPLFSARPGMHKRLFTYRELGFDLKMELKSQTSDMTLLLF